MEILDTQLAIRHLGEQLACEYSGALPPGRVLGLVTVTAHRLRRAGYRGAGLVDLTAATARTEITRRVGQRIAYNRLHPASAQLR